MHTETKLEQANLTSVRGQFSFQKAAIAKTLEQKTASTYQEHPESKKLFETTHCAECNFRPDHGFIFQMVQKYKIPEAENPLSIMRKLSVSIKHHHYNALCPAEISLEAS
jgi:hypothetical protein